jgi:hypothetical protein
MRQQGTSGKIRYHVLIALMCLCCIGFAIQPVLAAFPSEAAQEKFLKEYGAEIMAKAPKNIKEGTRLEQARYGYTKWCEELSSLSAGVNTNAFTRLIYDDNQLTCSHHALVLQVIFQGMGIDKNEMILLEADSDSWIPTPNSNHGALTVRDNDGKAYVFDPWQMATDQYYDWSRITRLYSGSASSPYNGMPVAQWGDKMTKAGYVRFSGDLEASWQKTAARATERGFNPSGPPPPEAPPEIKTDPCAGCEIRTGYEIIGFDMSYCDNCPNDERKKNANKQPVAVDPCARCAIYIPGENMSGCENCPRVK